MSEVFAKRSEGEYIQRVMESSQYLSGEWFRPQPVAQILCHAGFETNTSRIARICNSMVEIGTMEVYEQDMEVPGKAVRQKLYRRKVNNRKYLTMPWRKHSNEQLEVSQCCLFPA